MRTKTTARKPLLAALLLAPLAALHADEFCVATNGADSHPGTLERPFRTIRKAASVAAPGDTVVIRAGTYRETVAPPRSGEAGRPITFRVLNNTLAASDWSLGWMHCPTPETLVANNIVLARAAPVWSVPLTPWAQTARHRTWALSRMA